jgi:hypothetical protein
VRFPDARAATGRPPRRRDPVTVQCADGFQPASVTINPGQPLMIDLLQSARITLRLEAPDDGPSDLASWQAAHDAELLRRVFTKGSSAGSR